MKYNNLDEIKRNLRAYNSVEEYSNKLEIKPIRHSRSSPPELHITDKGGKYLVNYFGGKYINKEEALKSCGLDPERLYKATETLSSYTPINKKPKRDKTLKNPIQCRATNGDKWHTKVKKLLDNGYEILKADAELCNTYGRLSGKLFDWEQLRKHYNLVKFAKRDNELLLLWNRRETLINTHNKNTVLIAEGFTNNLALLSKKVEQFYAIGLRYNLTTLPVFRYPFNCYIFIRDKNEQSDHLNNRIRKYYSGIDALFFTVGSEIYEPESDLDDFLLKADSKELIDRIRDNMKGVSNG